MEFFYRKNDIGVDIEYCVIGYYLVEGVQHRIYTDFVDDKDSVLGMRIFVDRMINNEYVRTNIQEEEILINKFNDEINSFCKQKMYSGK